MKQFLLLLAAMTACTPAATAPMPSDAPAASAPVAVAPSSAATSAVAPAVTASAAPSPTITPAAAAPASDSPTLAPTDALATPARTAAPPVEIGAVRNDGQRILVTFDPPRPWYFGEAGGSPATNVGNYRLNGTSLAGSAMRCVRQSYVASGNLCDGLEIVPSFRIQNAARYELRLSDEVIGAFTARGLLVATPRVVGVSATQFDLTVTFDRPMLHVGTCGTQSWNLSTPGTIEYVRVAAQIFPPPVGAYTSSSAAYRDFLSAFVSGADISEDCTTVKLGSGWGGPTGRFDVTVSGVEDAYGNLVEPRTVTVEIQDQGPPRLMFAQLELQTAEKKVIRVAYSEAMDQAYVTDPQRYSLNGTPIPATTQIECELANCTWVRLVFPPTAFAYGADNTLTVVGVRDTAGNAMTPDIATSGTFQVR